MPGPERLLLRRGHGTPDPGASAPGTGGSDTRRRRVVRRGVVGACAGALVMLVACGGLVLAGHTPAFLAPTAGGGGGSSDTGTPLTVAPGACLTWEQADASDLDQVDCARDHLVELSGAVTAPGAPGAPFPSDDAWQQLVSGQCAPQASSYLGVPLDPAGRFRVGALKPTPAAWAEGDRTVRCGLQAPGRSGALLTSTGRVRDADQAPVSPPGTCLGLAGKDVADPVDCATAHAVEVAGTADLGARFPGPLPAVPDQDQYLQSACSTVAAGHVGGPAKLAASKLTVYWTNITGPSWDAGTRRVSCNLAALLPDGSGFAPLTGRAATGVTVGGPTG